MANRPCFGVIVCPHCGMNNPTIWDGNRKDKCSHCGKTIKIARQKLKNVNYDLIHKKSKEELIELEETAKKFETEL